MNYSVLILDDQLKKRKKAYTRFQQKINKNPFGFSVDFDYCNSPHLIPDMINNKNYSAAIIDVIYDTGSWKTYDVSKVLDILIGNNWDKPFLLISFEWSQAAGNSINKVMNSNLFKGFLHYRDIDTDNFQGDSEYAILAIKKAIYGELVIDNDLEINSNETINILQFSDLQYGGFSPIDLSTETSSITEKIFETLGDDRLHFMAFSGDIAQRGMPDEYDNAFKWLKDFAGDFDINLPSSRLLVVPGNHDCCIPLAGATRINLKSKTIKDTSVVQHYIELSKSMDSEQRNLLQYAYEPFLKFYHKTSLCPWLNVDDKYSGTPMVWLESSFRNYGIFFYGLNTAQPPTPDGLPKRSVNSDSLAVLSRKLNSYKDDVSKSTIIIGIGHHYPLSAHLDRAVSNPERVKEFLNRKPDTWLFLNGHLHQFGVEKVDIEGKDIIVSSTSTITLPEKDREKDTLRGFTLISIVREKNIPRMISIKAFGKHAVEYVLQKDVSYSRDDKGCFSKVY